MRPQSIVLVLNDFLFFAFGKGVFDAVEAHTLIEERGITSLAPTNRIGMIGNGEVSIDDYLSLLDENRYSAVFENGDILAMECRFDGEFLLGHRYFFLPCPFDLELVSSKPAHIPMAEWLRDSAHLEPLAVFRSRGALRFDCDRNPPLTGDPHPISHLTLGSGACRIPLRGPLQITAFLNFIFDNFFREYRPIWLSFLTQFRLREDEITIDPSEASLHHFNWELS